MNTIFESAKQNVVKDLKKLITEIEAKNEDDFVRLLMQYNGEEDPQFVALCHMFYIDDLRLNKYLKTLS